MVVIEDVEFGEPPDDPYAETDRWGYTDYGDRTIPTFSLSTGYKCTVVDCKRTFDDLKGFKHHVAQMHGLYRTKTLKCPHCGDEFDVEPSDADRRKFCSDDCRRKEDRNRVLLTCENCRDLFEVVKSKSKNRRFCSRECYADAHRLSREERDIETCETCDEEFVISPSEDREYCSQECFRKRNMERFYADD